MAKLYVFAIGGTGSRVLKSLTMLLAAGVECADEICPIIIDPDAGNGNLIDNCNVLKLYENIRAQITFDTNTKNRFFKTKISDQTGSNYLYNIDATNISNQTFGQYIGVNTMSKQNQALAKILYSQANMDAKMDVGFKGNPNMGSVVLNQFGTPINLNTLNQILNKVTTNDRIFIIGSLFGGTGASGIPLFLKTLRTNKNIVNNGVVNNLSIGILAIQPYFNINIPSTGSGIKHEIDSATFMGKTKAALLYYADNVVEMDTMYYLGDVDGGSAVEHHSGGNRQNNDPHIIEMIGALSIIDFVANGPKGHSNNATPVYKEFGINPKNNNTQLPNTINFSDLGNSTQALIKKPLVQMYFFKRYVDHYKKRNLVAQVWAKDGNYDDHYYDTPFYKDLERFMDLYKDWVDKMAANKRSFKCFDDEQRLLDSIVEITPRKDIGIVKKRHEDFMTSCLNNICKFGHGFKGHSKDTNFMELFYKGTEKVYNKKIKN